MPYWIELRSITISVVFFRPGESVKSRWSSSQAPHDLYSRVGADPYMRRVERI